MVNHKRIVLALTILIGAGILGSDPASGFDDDQRAMISVSGSAEVKVEPDEAVLTFSVESREEKLDAAVTDNDSKIKSVIEYLKASKVESKNIRTQVISIQPIFESNSPWKGQAYPSPLAPRIVSSVPPAGNNAGNKKPKIKPIGFSARRQLSITITDLAAFEGIYRGLIERGVNDVGGVQFHTTELRKYRDQARLKAIRAAREKAEAMAGELGATLASVHSINEGGITGWQPMLQNSVSVAGGSGSSGTLAAGLIEINANVSVVFVLGETELQSD